MLASDRIPRAGVAELAYAADSKSAAPRGRVGSSPTSGTRWSALAELRAGTRGRGQTLARIIGFAAFLAMSGPPLRATAQMHEFTGRVGRVTESLLVVHNRMGDRVSFSRSPETAVEGVRERWEAIRTEDQVTVHWQFSDAPRRAHRVVVLSGAK